MYHKQYKGEKPMNATLLKDALMTKDDLIDYFDSLYAYNNILIEDVLDHLDQDEVFLSEFIEGCQDLAWERKFDT